MSIYVPLVLEAVERLEAELLRIHHGVRGVAAWPSDSAADIGCIRAAIRRACQVTRDIREQVLENRGGAASSALRASALRARGVVLAIELSEMERAARVVEGPMPECRFRSVDEFRDFVLGEVGRINASWISEARQAAADEAAILSRAEAAYTALGRDADVSQFLAWGTSHESFAFRLACRVLAALLGCQAAGIEPVTIEVPSLPVLSRRASNANRAEEK